MLGQYLHAINAMLVWGESQLQVGTTQDDFGATGFDRDIFQEVLMTGSVAITQQALNQIV